jgi:ADP-ribose pyrophosphatase YjhB (NUDIX family)
LRWLATPDTLSLCLSVKKGQAVDHKIGVIPFSVDGDRIAIMFVTSQKRGRWILPKGNLKADEKHKKGCKREAFEEAGVSGKILKDFPITTAISKSTDTGLVQTAVTYYPMLVTQQADEWPEKHKRERHWALLKDAYQVTDREDFRQLIGLFDAISPAVLATAKRKIEQLPS